MNKETEAAFQKFKNKLWNWAVADTELGFTDKGMAKVTKLREETAQAEAEFRTLMVKLTVGDA